MKPIAPEIEAVSNIVFLKFPQRALDDQADELSQLIQDSSLLDIIHELEAKLGVMLGYLTELRDISDAEIARKYVSQT